MAAFPAQVDYLTVTGKLTRAGLDSVDADVFPDSVPMQGQLTFKPEIGKRLSNGALLSGGRVTIPTATPPLTIVVDPVPVALAADGTFSVSLIDPGSDPATSLLVPNGWSWTVEFDLVGATLPSFSFDSPAASSTVDLSKVTPIAVSSGSSVVIGPAGPPGPTGPTGPQGPIGVGLMSDAQLAAAVNTGATKTQLSSTYLPARAKAGRSYAFVAGVIRNYGAGLGWQLLTDGFHPPIGITNVDSLTDTGLIRVDYPGLNGGADALRTVTLIAQPDETLTKAGFTCGVSVDPGVCRIQLQQTRSLNDYIYYDVATTSFKRWKEEFWGVGRSPFQIVSNTNGHLILSHAQAVTDDRFDIGLGRYGGPGENYQPFTSTANAHTILNQVTINFWTDATSLVDSTRVVAPDAKCRAIVRRGMSRAAVAPADVSETTYPGGNIWILGMMQDQALGT